VSYTVQVTGVGLGKGVVTSEMTASTVPGVTVVKSELPIRLRSAGVQ
jgi:hypothetical protein